MISDDDCNRQGSFHFPAGFRTEDQYIAFWDAVAIPDRALRKLLRQKEPRERRIERTALGSYRATAQRYRELLRENEVDDSDRVDVSASAQAALAAVRDARAQITADVPTKLSKIEAEIRQSEGKLARRKSGDPEEVLTQVSARPVARATGLVKNIPAELDVTTRERILDHGFELGDGRWMSARDIVVRFKTLELNFQDPR